MKHLLSIFAVAVISVIAWGCSSGGDEEVPLSVTPGALTFSSSAGKQTVNVTGSKWEAISSQKWCTFEILDKQLKVAVTQNYSDKPRTAQITITSGSQSIVLGVSQKAGSGKFDGFTVGTLAFANLEPKGGDDVVVSCSEKNYTLEITTLSPKYTWKAVVTEGADFVVVPDDELYKGSGYLIFTVKSNNTVEERHAVLRIESEYEGAFCVYELEITQNSFNRNEDPSINDVIEW